MSEVTAKMVAELRATTGLGMMECKKALVEAEGDFAKAEEILRIKSGAKAGKLAGRTAAEGIIASYIEGNRGALVEVNCETDFVAKDESFKEFANDVAKAVVVNRPANLEQLSESQISVDQTVEERRKEIIAKLGENMTIRRFEYYETENQLTSYMHGNRIGVIVEFQGDEPTARDIAMHVAASRPQCVSSDQVDEELIEKERHIYTEQAAESGKPAEIIAKMVDGRLKKFLAEITLLGQQFVKNPDQTVEQLLKENDSKVIDFTVYHVGEGLEKKVTDYAAEVAAAAKV
ncbi:elongation factor Ts [Neisseriaceae bacterium PsAf]|nr:elongation factor Ts [Neisseriaceae bacterium PsAf]